MPFPYVTALQNTCSLHTPSDILNRAFLYAKDNIARCMRYYTLGWGMSNAPHNYTIVVGRDTGWMTLGTDYVAPWFAPEAWSVFRDRQKPNGQILEYIDLESGHGEEYGLNIADNTPFYLWSIHHHWEQFQDTAFLEAFLPSVRAAADHLLAEIGPRGLLVSVPAGVETRGITSWRNIIPGGVIAGEVTEINALSARGLRCAAELTGEPRYAAAAQQISEAIQTYLWKDGFYLHHIYQGVEEAQVTGDALFPLLCDVASSEGYAAVLARLEQPDFWTERGMRTLPTSHPSYHPNAAFGLLGGSWPNLTLWYAAAAARQNPDRALAALERVARPVLEEPEGAGVNGAEFPEFYDGETGENRGMKLSPWVAPTLIWAVMEGLLGLTWKNGQANWEPHWPTGWDEVRIDHLPAAGGFLNVTLNRPACSALSEGQSAAGA